MDLVSVIIPTYKGIHSICQSIDSVLNQDYKNIEIIVVDDNGEGTQEQIKTENAIKGYINNGKIKYIKHKKNINGSAARNTGVKHAKGKYIALLDDDDEFLPFKIRKQVEALSGKGKDYAVCYTSYENVFPNQRRRVIRAEKEGNLCYELLSMQVSVLSSVMMVRKDAWEDVGGFDETFKRDQDQEFCVRLFHKYKVVAVKDVCMTRNVLMRNVADVERGVEYRKYYLDKMKHIIETFNAEQRREIHSAQYTNIAKRYVKAKRFNKCLIYVLKSKTPFKATRKLLSSYRSYRKNLKDNSMKSSLNKIGG